MQYEVEGKVIEADEQGYIRDVSAWSPELALQIARREAIEMDEEKWEVVNFLRDYYEEYQIAPAARVLAKAIAKSLGPEKATSRYLYELFPHGPAKQGCKIAGLPKPTSCV
ncbi:MAG: TusE/DsrC/DsvC family sulfur relay protein [Lysobacterales bacterium]|jgi:tRNA 2-thiouridine synthesizing protein E